MDTNEELGILGSDLDIVDAGVMGYRAAWELQLELHGRVLGGEWREGR